MSNARDCAELLLETIPNLMRGLIRSVGQEQPSSDEGRNKNQFMSQFRLLEILRHKQRTIGELAALHGVTPSTMSRSVDVLVRRAWVDRESDPHDRRLLIVRLTDEGSTAHQEMVKHMHDSVTQLIEQLDDDEIAKLYDGLEVLQKLTKRVPQHCPAEGHQRDEEG